MGWDSFSKSLGAIIEERLFSPLVSGIIISWSILNWKFWAFVFWSRDLDDLLDRVAGLRDNPYDFILYYFAAPFVFAVGYVYILPKLSRPVTKRWRENLRQVDVDRMSVNELETIEVEKAQAIRSEILALKKAIKRAELDRDEADQRRDQSVEAQALAEFQRDSAKVEATQQRARSDDLKNQLQEAKTREDTQNNVLTGLRQILDANAKDPETLTRMIAAAVAAGSPFPAALSVIEMRVIGAMSNEEQTAAALAKLLGEGADEVQKAIQALQGRGFVAMTRAPTQGRSAGYRLQQRGVVLANKARQFRAFIAHVSLTEGERNELSAEKSGPP